MLKHNPVLNGIPCANLIYIGTLDADNDPVLNRRLPAVDVPSYKLMFELLLMLHIVILLINPHEYFKTVSVTLPLIKYESF
jgi:hypothetical protein